MFRIQMERNDSGHFRQLATEPRSSSLISRRPQLEHVLIHNTDPNDIEVSAAVTRALVKKFSRRRLSPDV